MKNSLFVLIAAFLFGWADAGAAEGPSITFTDQDRVLVLAPHPDDETLGVAGVIQSALRAKASVKVVYFTHGDDNEISSIFYLKKPLITRNSILRIGGVREKEAKAAMAALGLSSTNLVFLGYPDAGLLRIWRQHWGSAKPYRSFLTKINRVPYQEDSNFGSYYKGENIERDLKQILFTFRPTHVFVTAPFDRHPDHEAAFLFLRVALLDLADQLPSPGTDMYLVHAHRWPRPRGYLPAGALNPPLELVLKEGEWLRFALGPDEVRRKREALERYASQMSYRKKFLLSFVRANELFAELPDEKLRNDGGAKPSRDADFSLKDGELWATIRFNEAFDQRGALGLEIFGYKKGVPFSAMPKLSLKLFGRRLVVREVSKGFFGGAIFYKLEPEGVVIRMSMRHLNNPETLFVLVDTLKEKASPDFGSWRVLS